MINNLFQPANDIPEWIKMIDMIRDVIFKAAFILNRIKDIPIGQYSMMLASVAMLGFFLANCLQLISSQYYHIDNNRSFGNILALSAVFGVIASIGFLIQPQIWLVWIWLFVLNNLCWYIAEYLRCHHQYTNTYPPLNQPGDVYLKHVQWLLIASICSSVCFSLSACFSIYATPLFFLGLGLNYLATIIAFIQLIPQESSIANKYHNFRLSNA